MLFGFEAPEVTDFNFSFNHFLSGLPTSTQKQLPHLNPSQGISVVHLLESVTVTIIDQRSRSRQVTKGARQADGPSLSICCKVCRFFPRTPRKLQKIIYSKHFHPVSNCCDEAELYT